ncbi:unnamed protein product [Orchesella dallaii]|uniref:Uncharacterized protein n=1 Tax=Orchesella dallaii TaxID=48710 RepID=A0ABP1PJF8_9HEXA
MSSHATLAGRVKSQDKEVHDGIRQNDAFNYNLVEVMGRQLLPEEIMCGVDMDRSPVQMTRQIGPTYLEVSN